MSCNPAEYYLPLPEPLETAIAMLSKPQLLSVITDLVDALYLEEPVETVYLAPEADDDINALTEDNKIALLRWMFERLAWFKSQEKSSDGQS